MHGCTQGANAGDVNVLKLLLSRKSADTDGINLQDDTGTSPLHLASAHGHTGAGQLLLKHGALVRGTTVGHARTKCVGECQSCMVMLSQVDLEDKEGRVALHYAANGEHIKMARLLLQVRVY